MQTAYSTAFVSSFGIASYLLFLRPAYVDAVDVIRQQVYHERLIDAVLLVGF